jgi:hypothetical protein
MNSFHALDSAATVIGCVRIAETFSNKLVRRERFGLVFGRYLGRISAGTPVILTEVYLDFFFIATSPQIMGGCLH